MLYIPKISPIRIKQLGVGDNLPQDLGGEFYGVDYVNFCNEWAINQPLTFQIFSDSANPIIKVGDTNITPTDITPTGWAGLGNYVYEISYTPTAEGDFRFLLIEDIYFFESDLIKVISDTSHLIKIDYSNSENDYGYVGSTQLTAYVDGEYRTVQPSNEMTVYENDRAELTKLRSTPIEKYELNIYNSIYSVANMLNMIFSCDTILINGESFQSDEVPNVEAIEMSNIFNISIIISRTSDNYEYFTQQADGLDFIGDNSDEILSDNENKLIVL